MPRINLFGTDGQRAINIGHLPEVPSVVEPEFDNKTHHRKASFAAMNALEYDLRDARVPVGHAWHFVKSWYGVESRSEFTTEQWCIISARLNACRRDAALLRDFIQQVREFNAPAAPVEPITPTEPIQGLGWHCRTDFTGMFFDDRRVGNRKRRRHVVAWLNYKRKPSDHYHRDGTLSHANGVFSLNIVSTELALEGPLPQNVDLETVVDFIYKHARWQ